MEINYFVAFTLGVFSTIHCLGMCGGIITALSLGLRDDIKQDKKKFFPIVCTYNIGRVFSYAIAGALAGMFGHLVLNPEADTTGYYLLRILAGSILILLGLHIAGWTSAIRRIEGLGMKAWKVIQPVGRYFLPVDSPLKAIVLGCLWGWLPCGLVYSVLLWSATSADPVSGMVYMICFGLGTLPGMITAGILSSSLQQLARSVNIRKTFAVIIICFGLVSPWIQIHHHDHSPATESHHNH